SSENPAGSADPVRSTGRAGRGVLSLRRVSLHKQRKVARAVTARKLLDLPWLLPLPSKERSRTARCARPSSALRPPSPASGRTVAAVPGAWAGCAFFAPGFLAQAKKGGSRRHGAKAFDLDVGGTGTAGGSRPALRGFGEERRVKTRPTGLW